MAARKKTDAPPAAALVPTTPPVKITQRAKTPPAAPPAAPPLAPPAAPPVAAPAATPLAAPLEPVRSAPTHDAIARRAYEIFCERGGTAFDNWIEAERQLRA